jgi:protein TonB
MTGSVTTCLPQSDETGAPSRLSVALAVSVVSHLLFVQALTPEVPRRNVSAAGAFPLAVRIEPLPGPTLDIPTATGTEELSRPLQRRQRPVTADVDERRALPRMAPVAPPLSLPQIPDPTVYAARDLDSYPRLAAPLDTGRIEPLKSGAPAVVRLEVTIDERGIVNDVAIVGPGPAADVEKETVAMLTAARFVPARKDGRAVKSRVVLSIDLAKDGAR